MGLTGSNPRMVDDALKTTGTPPLFWRFQFSLAPPPEPLRTQGFLTRSTTWEGTTIAASTRQQDLNLVEPDDDNGSEEGNSFIEEGDMEASDLQRSDLDVYDASTE